MNLEERGEFEAQLAQLCAGFNVPMTAERIEAYWRGLGRMTLPTFCRVVEAALGEHGPEKMPTTAQLWMTYRNIRRGRASSPPPEPVGTTSLPAADQYHTLGQIVLLRFLVRHGGLPTKDLFAVIDEKNRLVEQARAAGELDPEHFERVATRALEAAIAKTGE